MVSDRQVKELRRWLSLGKSLAASARIAEMDEKTARRYRDDQQLPSERRAVAREYRTRIDPFEDVWTEVQHRLEADRDSRPRRSSGGFRGVFQGSFPTRPAGPSNDECVCGEAPKVPAKR